MPTKTPSVADYLAYWLREVVEPNLAPLTHSTYDTLTRLFIVPGVGGKRIDRLQVRDVQTSASHLVDTYERARSLAEFSALDLADALDVTAQNINNRLRRLVAAGALLRRRLPSDHGGKEFSYRTEPPHEAADESSAAAAGDPAARRHRALSIADSTEPTTARRP